MRHFGALLIITTACLMACTGTSVDSPGESQGEIVAEVEGTAITLEELDQSIASKLYDLRSEGLEALIEQRLLDREAERRGISTDELVEQVAAEAPPVTDEAVAAFFNENAARIPKGATLEAIGPQIRELLEQARRQQAVASLVDGANIVLLLEPPRIEVAAIGPSIGPADAAVTIVEFSDYQCPYCAGAEKVLQELLAMYPDDVRLVYRHMPLDFHANARPAAIAAVCADEQGRFWDYHAEVFANQQALETDNLASFADGLGLDRAAFDTCLASAEAAARVDLDVRDAGAAGATGTPAFNVNGIQWSGTRPLEKMVELVEQELARKQQIGG